MSEIKKVGVVGCGLMGSGIAEVCARAGADVIAWEVSEQAAEAGRARVGKSLERGVRTGKLTAEQAQAAQGRLTFSSQLADLADRDLVLEAAVEDPEIKTGILRQLDQGVEQPDAILATNTSSIPIVQLAGATRRPAQVLGVHFFNPAPVQRLGRLRPSGPRGRAREFGAQVLGKPALQAQDRAGFVVNALLAPYLLAAVRMVEAGHASARDIDAGMVLGCAHPMGPLTLADLIGLDTLKSIADSMYEEYKEPLYAAPPLLRRMTDAGVLGRER